MKRRYLPMLPLLLLLGLGVVWFQARDHWESHHGETMGTTFRVQWSTRSRAGEGDRLRAAIDQVLDQVNAEMSTYRPDSEIRRFAASPAGQWFSVSRETEEVVRAACVLAAKTGGAFDPTVGPLVDLWGFGSAGRRTTVPDSAQILQARSRTGWGRIETRSDPPALRRDADTVQLDLSAIAKGHGVDRVAQTLETGGAGSYLVEIGGEVRLRGRGPHGTWFVALEPPGAASSASLGKDGPGGRERDPESREEAGPGGQWAHDQASSPSPGPLRFGLHLETGAVATSGTYRNSFAADGARFHHAIDPRTGYPATHSTVQVTVIAEDCESADARATALLVLGEDEGFRLAEAEGWAARFVVATRAPGGWDERVTASFPARARTGKGGAVR